jgi:hypothetical protein
MVFPLFRLLRDGLGGGGGGGSGARKLSSFSVEKKDGTVTKIQAMDYEHSNGSFLFRLEDGNTEKVPDADVIEVRKD